MSVAAKPKLNATTISKPNPAAMQPETELAIGGAEWHTGDVADLAMGELAKEWQLDRVVLLW